MKVLAIPVSGRKSVLYFFTVCCFIIALLLATSNAQAQPSMSWSDWVQQLRQEAVAQGINPVLFDQLFAGMTPNSSILHFDKTQPERRLTFMQYRNSRIDPYRIRLGQSEFQKNQNLLQQVGNSYGVDPCFIAAFWGIETSYGRYMGTFSVIRSLATLAYDSPRGSYFRGELLVALQILNDGHITPNKFVGEWAGASGMPQFMPSSWMKYAVDFDGDGHKNIWTSYPDAFASIANYLRMNGWQSGQPWGVQVNLPAGFNSADVGLNQTRPISDWLRMGVQPVNMAALPSNQATTASIIMPYGGPAFMVFNNFRVVMKYNNSTFYAGSVSYLADQICRRN